MNRTKNIKWSVSKTTIYNNTLYLRKINLILFQFVRKLQYTHMFLPNIISLKLLSEYRQNTPLSIDRFSLAYKSPSANLLNLRTSKLDNIVNFFDKVPKNEEFKWFIPLVKWTLFPNKRYFDVHHSFNSFCINTSGFGIHIMSMRKLSTVWSKIFRLFFSLYFYNIRTLTFGSSFFRDEINNLNWGVLSTQKTLWKYVRPFFTVYHTSINYKNYKLFYLLKYFNATTTIITDVNYHSKTLFYLHRLHFYSIGPVPLNMNKNTVNFAVPLMGDTLLTNLLFVRFTLFIRGESSRLRNTIYLDSVI